MNIFKKIQLFNLYRKTINENKQNLFINYKIKVDKIYRLYTVFTVEEADYKTYGDELVTEMLNKYLRKLDNTLQNMGLSELYGVSEKEKLSEREYRIVIRYAHLDTEFWANTVLFSSVALISLAIIGAVFFGLYAYFLA